jgi:hypothetical protein
MAPMQIRVLLVPGSLLMSGCVGLAVGTFGTFESGKEVGSRFSETREMLFSARGAPDSVESHGRCETLIYQHGWSWSGVGAFLGFVPVPLLVPSGYDEERLYLRDGRTVGEVSEYGEVTGMLGSCVETTSASSRPGASIATRGARPPCPGASERSRRAKHRQIRPVRKRSQ